jgi:hypothetical protein
MSVKKRALPNYVDKNLHICKMSKLPKCNQLFVTFGRIDTWVHLSTAKWISLDKSLSMNVIQVRGTTFRYTSRKWNSFINRESDAMNYLLNTSVLSWSTYGSFKKHVGGHWLNCPAITMLIDWIFKFLPTKNIDCTSEAFMKQIILLIATIYQFLEFWKKWKGGSISLCWVFSKSRDFVIKGLWQALNSDFKGRLTLCKVLQKLHIVVICDSQSYVKCYRQDRQR